jgi:hypothetical protein
MEERERRDQERETHIRKTLLLSPSSSIPLPLFLSLSRGDGYVKKTEENPRRKD